MPRKGRRQALLGDNKKRVGVFGWGLVAPRSADISAFEKNLESAESWLEPFDGFGPDNFLVGNPSFDLETYREWLAARFRPSRFAQIREKMGAPTQYAMGSFIQALDQNPGLEKELQDLGGLAHVYVGTGLGDLPTIYDTSIRLDRAQERWDRFWAASEHNSVRRGTGSTDDEGTRPPDPATVETDEHSEAERQWNRYWAAKSPELREYLEELRVIEAVDVQGETEAGKRSVIRQKRTGNARLQEKWGAPTPPWDDKRLAQTIWNLHNTPAANISMVGKIIGLSFAPVGACATFGVCLKLAMDAIQQGEARAVVVGAADPAPHPLTVGAFYNARVISADKEVSRPLTGLRGTHISGGAAIWIVGDFDYMTEKGYSPLGVEPLGVGVSSDADHIITPSKEGPLQAIGDALKAAGTAAGDLATWDLHATATPGDYQEVENLRRVISEDVIVTARKGIFGHGMGVSGGWELTAQYLGLARDRLLPTPLPEGDLNAEIAGLHRRFVFDQACEAPSGAAGKISMGVGGVNACVISRKW